ncbi:TPA: hypothetical protein N0F65_000610 [Lagenidium giganteum]|uniref:Uncharacterized protein n=1 Tax=Lagenidium giganteum TaxID=4803 RepID=A0AAV2YNS2_9STRA|nr:TPA: hypothetical protein N0F65_000610 [Lagenidium giganteum]
MNRLLQKFVSADASSAPPQPHAPPTQGSTAGDWASTRLQEIEQPQQAPAHHQDQSGHSGQQHDPHQQQGYDQYQNQYAQQYDQGYYNGYDPDYYGYYNQNGQQQQSEYPPGSQGHDPNGYYQDPNAYAHDNGGSHLDEIPLTGPSPGHNYDTVDLDDNSSAQPGSNRGQDQHKQHHEPTYALHQSYAQYENGFYDPNHQQDAYATAQNGYDQYQHQDHQQTDQSGLFGNTSSSDAFFQNHEETQASNDNTSSPAPASDSLFDSPAQGNDVSDPFSSHSLNDPFASSHASSNDPFAHSSPGNSSDPFARSSAAPTTPASNSHFEHPAMANSVNDPVGGGHASSNDPFANSSPPKSSHPFGNSTVASTGPESNSHLSDYAVMNDVGDPFASSQPPSSDPFAHSSPAKSNDPFAYSAAASSEPFASEASGAAANIFSSNAAQSATPSNSNDMFGSSSPVMEEATDLFASSANDTASLFASAPADSSSVFTPPATQETSTGPTSPGRVTELFGASEQDQLDEAARQHPTSPIRVDNLFHGDAQAVDPFQLSNASTDGFAAAPQVDQTGSSESLFPPQSAADSVFSQMEPRGYGYPQDQPQFQASYDQPNHSADELFSSHTPNETLAPTPTPAPTQAPAVTSALPQSMSTAVAAAAAEAIPPSLQTIAFDSSRPTGPPAPKAATATHELSPSAPANVVVEEKIVEATHALQAVSLQSDPAHEASVIHQPASPVKPAAPSSVAVTQSHHGQHATSNAAVEDSMRLAEMYKRMAERLETEKAELLQVLTDQADQFYQMQDYINSLERELAMHRTQHQHQQVPSATTT